MPDTKPMRARTYRVSIDLSTGDYDGLTRFVRHALKTAWRVFGLRCIAQSCTEIGVTTNKQPGRSRDEPSSR